MALPQNRQGVREILDVLEPRILGRASSGRPVVATAIEPAGGRYPGQETCWAVWSVEMTPGHPGENAWSTRLSEFVPVEEIKALFAKHFPDGETKSNPYKLVVKGAERVWAKLPAAVCIMDNGFQTRFCIDWGREQKLARATDQVFSRHVRFMPLGSEGYTAVVALLRQLSPETYSGGPEPELSHEPRWLTNYFVAVDALAKAPYTKLFYQNNMSSFGGGRGESLGSIDIVFVKEN